MDRKERVLSKLDEATAEYVAAREVYHDAKLGYEIARGKLQAVRGVADRMDEPVRRMLVDIAHDEALNDSGARAARGA